MAVENSKINVFLQRYSIYIYKNNVRGVFEVADSDFEIKFSKFKMADPMWPPKRQKLMFFHNNFQFKKKSGLFCTTACLTCCGESCFNKTSVQDENDHKEICDVNEDL